MSIFQRKNVMAALSAATTVAIGPADSLSAETNDLPHFQDVFRLLRANLPNASEEELNRAAVRGLLDQFYPRVMLDTGNTGRSAGARVSKAALYDQAYGYLRVTDVAAGLADQIKSAYDKLEATNRLK